MRFTNINEKRRIRRHTLQPAPSESRMQKVVKTIRSLLIPRRCEHVSHQEMIAARDHCPTCRKRYVVWAESIGLRSVDIDHRPRVTHARGGFVRPDDEDQFFDL